MLPVYSLVLTFAADEQKFAVNMKQQLAASFAHTVRDADQYEHVASDQFGEKTVRVQRDGAKLSSVSDEPRPIQMRFKRQVCNCFISTVKVTQCSARCTA